MRATWTGGFDLTEDKLGNSQTILLLDCVQQSQSMVLWCERGREKKVSDNISNRKKHNNSQQSGMFTKK